MAPTTIADTRELIRKRATAKARLTSFIKYVAACKDEEFLEIDEVHVRIAKMEKDCETFESIQDALELAASDDEYETRLAERTEIDDSYLRSIARAKRLIREFEARTVQSSQSNNPHLAVNSQSPLTINSESHVKLPTLHLPTFSGSYEAWPSFCDVFKAAVHDNVNFHDAQKLINLRSCLTGKAAEKIESLGTTTANYSVAWNLLEKFYDAPGIVISNRIQAMFELPTVARFNVDSLGELVDQATKHYRALQALNRPFLEAFPIYTITSKLDNHTRLLWKEKTQGESSPSMESLLEFLHDRQKLLGTARCESSHKPESPNVRSNGKTNPSNKSSQSLRAHSVTNITCALCQGKHFTQSCVKLVDAKLEKRYALIKKAELCSNCLRVGHIAKNCMASTCKRCNEKHHTLLHKDRPDDSRDAVQVNVSALGANAGAEVLLSTAVVNFRDIHGNRQPCRLLLDSGSQSHFLTERFAKRLGLPYQDVKIPITGIAQKSTFIKKAIRTSLYSRVNQFNVDATFLIIQQVTEPVPSQTFSKTDLKLPRNLPLADPNFNTPAEVDGLIGNELYLKLLCIGQLLLADDTIAIQKTRLGWIVAGKLTHNANNNLIRCNVARDALHYQLTRFWEVEEMPREPLMSAENQACEEHFQSHFDREPVTGRYIVRLPFKDNVLNLGESHSVALKRFYSLERKLAKCPDVKREYETFMDDYLRLGHMFPLKTSPTEQGYFLPHHSVVKQSSLTTKLRVVFDASAKTTNGTSLNDALLVGPTIQEDLFSILVRFRSHSYVMTADVEKMYRQILVHPKDRVYQKVLWRSNVCDPIKTYMLNTVTYGTSAAPFLAIRTLHQLAADEGKEFSRAATILREDFYVDDLLTGARTYDEAVIIRDELIDICKRAGFKLRQWAANDERLTETLGDRTNDRLLRLDLDDTVKTLGLRWNAKRDTITYDIEELRQPNRVTKRTILSQTATLFDPLGILGPVIVRAKILLQSLWKLQLDWDESVPLDIHTQWSTYCRDLIQLKNLKIRRQITPREYEMLQLHGFCDASEQAYGACIYVRGVDKHGKISTQLIASKSRVAPIKTITLPRLELCAAHLLSRLYETVIGALRRLSFQKTIFWSDSTIVLHWIRTSPHLLKTFVSHRIADIQKLTQAHEWRHVQSADNPADLISRGSNVATLLSNHIWHHGPEWLGEREIKWPLNQWDLATEIPEMRPLVTLHIHNREFNLFEKYSSYGKLKRVVAYLLRFRFITSRKESQNGTLTVTELRGAERCIIKCIQGRACKDELRALGAGRHATSLAPLNPFIDATGILRVGGRLSKAHIQPDMKHPILLPKDEHTTELIIREHHVNSIHAGTQATLNNLRQKFWIPNGRNIVRRIIHRCTICHRAKPPIASYKMSDLPASRLVEARPFLRAGVDYCGPIYIKEKTHRNRNKIKVYLAIFICFSTKAIHIEIVSDLTTEAFLAALCRFMARRGQCSDIYSDNATNFTGASKELKDLERIVKSQTYNDVIASALANEGKTWHFIPPRSPHFGGLGEAAVRSTKHHLTRVIGETLLSYEALLTYVKQVEAILNSRPITPVSSDPNDLTALTPGHFLIGDRLTSLPEVDYSQVPDGRLSSWQHVQKMKAHFWKRWHKEYLHEQNTRKKWHSGKAPEIAVGTMVLVKEDNTPPMTWPLGRIVAIHPGDDGVIRVVTVKTAHGEYKRCVKRIAPLPVPDDPSS